MITCDRTPSKYSCLYCLMGFCTGGIFFFLYTTDWDINFNPIRSRSRIFSKFDSQLSSPNTAMNQDLPIKFLSNMTDKELKQVSSWRNPYSTAKVRTKEMLPNRLFDNYRFCLKVAPFVGPYNYITNSKNPCWYDSAGALKCIAYFYLAGFSKCGTTDLYSKILGHPGVTGSPGSKEKHWFDYRRYSKNEDDISAFSYKFMSGTERIENEIRTNESSYTILGDGTPCNVWYSLYWPCYEGNQHLTAPRYTNADVIYRLNPRSKVIILLRDPVSRLYSRYQTWVDKITVSEYINPSPEKFHNICKLSIYLYKQCFLQWTPRHCAYNGTLYTLAKSRLQEGIYSVFLKDWLKVFPRNQLMILKFEEYIQDIPGYLSKIYKFLGLAPLSESHLESIAKQSTRNKGKYTIGPMLDKTRIMLQIFYGQFNRELPRLLGDSKWLWGYE